jgi:FAD/FMN-containing dehydrogenase
VSDRFAALAADIAGEVFRPGDAGHQLARKMFIGRQDEVVPDAVVACAGEDDVRTTLAFVRQHGIRFAVRGGGHSFAEHSTSDGVVVDLGGLDTAEVLADRVIVGAGVRVGALADRLARHGLVVPIGWCRSVGVTGAVLGGGYGVLSRYYGLGADHLLAARVLLSDGRTVRAAADEHPDLFWALRGAGGGSFGVVLSVELRTRPAVPLVTLRATWPHELSTTVVETWQRHAPTAPREVNVELALYAGDFPDEPAAVALFGVVVADDPTAAHAVLDRFPCTAEQHVTTLPANLAATFCDYPGDAAEHTLPRLSPGERAALRLSHAGFLAHPLPRPTLDALTAHLVQDRAYGVYRDLELIPWGGAIATPHGGAIAHRDKAFLVKHTVQTGTRATARIRAAATAWVGASYAITHPAGAGTGYPNYPDLAHAGDPAHYYGEHLPRLRDVKAAYDPTGMFRCGVGWEPAQTIGPGQPEPPTPPSPGRELPGQ